MKTTEPVEWNVRESHSQMKSENQNARTAGAGRKRMPLGGGHMPIEWMDAMCWRLPSGKALAEFALQSGFLAPLILGGRIARAEKQTAGSAGSPAGARGLPETR